MSLDPGGLIAWLIVGLVAGWLAGRIMKGGYGLIGDLVLGIVGAYFGGFIFTLVLPDSSVRFVGSIIVALIGAIILIAVVRALKRTRTV